ncbi:glycosyl transferase family 2 [Vibrio cholerae CT 5369-93]|nr:glycosyl transferase family 2 [Vibrio cholerae CT 5369-93]
MSVKLNILILNWNSANDVANLLRSLEKSAFLDFRVILVHNATSDQDAITELYKLYSKKFEVHLVINDSNLGYAGGNNSGYEYIEKSGLAGDLAIINPDVELDKNTLSEMYNLLIKEGVGGVMCRALNEQGGIIYDHIELVGFMSKYKITKEEEVETDYLAGSCMMLKREVVSETGLFDPNFFMYWEEVDLSLRVKQRGYRLLSTTRCQILRAQNDNSRSLNALNYSIRNSFLIREKYPSFGWLSHVFYLFRMLALAIIKSIKYGNFCYIKGFFLTCFIDDLDS